MSDDLEHNNCRYTDPAMFELQDKMARTMYGTVRGGYVDHAWAHDADRFKDMPLVSEDNRAFYMRMAFVAIEVMREHVGS